MGNTQLQGTERDLTTQQMEVRPQGHISRIKCRVSAGESTNETQQVVSDVGQKRLPHVPVGSLPIQERYEKEKRWLHNEQGKGTTQG
jgi:hypothetical protein